MYMRIVKASTYFSFFLGFFLSAPAELDRPRLALASDLTELCEPERLPLLLFLSFDLSRPLALALSISIASDAPGWFFSGPTLGLDLPEVGLDSPTGVMEEGKEGVSLSKLDLTWKGYKFTQKHSE